MNAVCCQSHRLAQFMEKQGETVQDLEMETNLIMVDWGRTS